MSTGSIRWKGEFVVCACVCVCAYNTTAFSFKPMNCIHGARARMLFVRMLCVVHAGIFSRFQRWHVYRRTTHTVSQRTYAKACEISSYKYVSVHVHTHTHTHTAHTEFGKPQKCTWQRAIFCHKCLPHPCVCQYKLFQQIFPDVGFAVIALRCMASEYYLRCWKDSTIVK